MKQKTDIATKPYYRCFTCPRFRNTCGGRPTRDMDHKEWCEYMRDTRDFYRIPNALIAGKADVSIKTIERIMAIDTTQDIMRYIARRVEQAVIGPVGEFTCYLDHACDEQIAALHAEITALREEVAYWRKENDRKAKIIDKYLE